MIRVLLATFIALLGALPAVAFTFENIDGGTHDLSKWRGQPVLVVNTASLCGFSDQYGDLQTLHDRYRGKGLVVLAVPSDDFNQELASNAEVRDYCALNYALTLPMTNITPVRGPNAHPFYRWARENAGFVPRWNFNKVLLDQTGQIVATYGSNANPLGAGMRRDIEQLLSQ